MSTIALCMIIKNPDEGLKKCLESVKPIIDEYRIVSTHRKYTDAIIKICNETIGPEKGRVLFCDKKCESCNPFNEEPCFNLDYARNLSFEDVKSDWILWLDADDVVLGDNPKKIKDIADGDVSKTIGSILMSYDYSASNVLVRERLIRNKNLKNIWKLPVHESIAYFELGLSILRDDVHITHTRCVDLSIGRNIKIFEKACRYRSKECFNDPRFVFYYAITLHHSGCYAEAIVQYEHALSMSLWDGDKFLAYLGMAQCLRSTQRAVEGIEWCNKAINLEPGCAEGYFEKGLCYEEIKEYGRAIENYKNCLRPHPKKIFVIDANLYGYRPLERIYICYTNLGMWDESWEWMQKCEKALPNGLSIVTTDKDIISSHIKKTIEQPNKKRATSFLHIPTLEDKKVTARLSTSGYTHIGIPDVDVVRDSELPSIRMRLGAIVKLMRNKLDKYMVHRAVPANIHDLDIVLMTLPYDMNIANLCAEHDVPIVLDYPEDLLGCSSALSQENRDKIERLIKLDIVKVVICSSPLLNKQIGEKAVYIPEMMMDKGDSNV